MAEEKSGLEVFRFVQQAAKVATDSSSFADIARSSVVEPIVLIDTDLQFNEILPDLLQCLQNTFAAFYLTAWRQVIEINDVDVTRQLNRMNPNRSKMDALISTSYAAESYSKRLPTTAELVMAAENLQKKDENVMAITEANSLATGKVLKVVINSNGKPLDIEVLIRFAPRYVISKLMTTLLGGTGEQATFKERLLKYRIGDLKFIRDMIFCRDIVDNYTQKLGSDKDGSLREIVDRQNKSKIASIVSGEMSLGTASNIVILSDSTAVQVESAIGGQLSDFKVRQKAIKETSLMFIAVLDKEWERVTIYTRGFRDPIQLNARDLKSQAKGTGPDINEILKAYRLGSTPSL